MLVALTDELSLDPEVWFDVLNGAVNQGCKEARIEVKRKFNAETNEAHWAPTFSDFAANQSQFQMEEVREFISQLARHFVKERREVGLHGLYTKYRDYSRGIAALMSFHGHLFVSLNINQDKMAQNYTPSDKRKPLKITQ